MKGFKGLLIFLSFFVIFSCEPKEEHDEDDGKCHDKDCPDGYKCSPVTNECECEVDAVDCKNETCPKGRYCSTVTNKCDCEYHDCEKEICPYGFETDHNECEVCLCKEKISCKDKDCDDGYKCSPVTNKCDCEEKVRCRMLECSRGWVKDEKGCDKCECVPPCKNETCLSEKYCSTNTNECDCYYYDWCKDLNCTYGFETDHNECAVCLCKEKPSCEDCDVATTTTKEPGWWKRNFG